MVEWSAAIGAPEDLVGFVEIEVGGAEVAHCEKVWVQVCFAFRIDWHVEEWIRVAIGVERGEGAERG